MNKADIADIIVDESRNVRGKVDKDGDPYKELVFSVKKYGILQPVGLCKNKDKYNIVWGFRRVMAATDAGLKQVPCVFVKSGEKRQIISGLVENLHREDMNPLDEAEVMNKLVSEYGMKPASIARAIGKTRGWIDQRISLLSVDDDVREMVRSGEVGFSSAREISTLPREDQDKIVKHVKNTIKKGKKVLHNDVKKEKRVILRDRIKSMRASVDADSEKRLDDIKKEKGREIMDAFFKERGQAYCDSVYITKKTISDFYDFLEKKNLIRWI